MHSKYQRQIITSISYSTSGSTSVNIQFNLNRDIDAAAQDVGQAISAAQKSLPQNLPTPPTYKKVDPSEQPVLYLAVRSEHFPLYKVNDYAQRIADQISILPGVAQVELQGPQQFAVRIYIDAQLAALRNLSLTEIGQALNNANVNSPTGQLNGDFETQIIKSSSELFEAKDYDNLILSNHENESLRVKDIGKAVNSVANDRTAAWFMKDRCILLAVSRQPGANTIEVVDAALNLLPGIRNHLPPTVSIDIVTDRSTSIRDSVEDVEITFLLSVVLVVGVIYLFLQSFSATFIPALTLPLSMMGTFVLMYYFGYSLNNLTLLALTLSVGFVVDDAIVVMENIAHYIEEKKDNLTAAILGSREITFTILSMTFSLVAVFLPILLLQGIVGRLFHEFGMTLSFAILLSGFIALTVSPMMSRYLLTSHQKMEKQVETRVRSKVSPLYWIQYFNNVIMEKFQHFFEKLRMRYVSSLNRVMKHQNLTLVILALMLLINVGLLIVIPKGFFPNEDTGLIYGVTEANSDISFKAMTKVHHKVMHILDENSDIDVYNASIGASSTTQALNNGRFFIRLKPFSQRKNSATVVMNHLRAQFNDIPEIKVYMQVVQNLRVGGSLAKSQYVYTLQGSDTKQLYSVANAMQSELGKIPGIIDVGSDITLNSSQLRVDIDRDRAYLLGVSVNAINDALNFAFGDQQVSLIYGSLNTYQVILRSFEDKSRSAQDLSHIYAKNNRNQLISLDSMVKLTPEATTLTVNHYNQLPAVTLSFNLNPGISLGDVIQKINQLEEKLFEGKDIFSIFQGSAKVFEESTKGSGWILLASILAIYIVLGMLYESFIHPITILSGIPTAGIGALLALYITGLQLDAISFIGIILLIGIMKKNAIMMVDYALQCKRDQKIKAQEAIIEAAGRRFRPIMMTTMAALMGTMPIALGLGAGAELRRPMGIAIVGGLILSQLLTLYITPVVFVKLDKYSKDPQLNPVIV
ncbi:MAG: efflux RND transporter permease subunit [Janthinobacterium lividum]